MKKAIFSLIIFLLITLSVCAQENSTGNNNSSSDRNYLIVYYSWSGNSRIIANKLHSILNCDIVEILPSTPYTTDYNTMLNVAQREISAIDASGSYPSITNNIESFEDYGAIFICYPLWWSRMATPVQSFLHKHKDKLNGKRISLVCTSGSSGITRTVADARRICPDSVFTEALHIKSANVANAQNLLTQWMEAMK